MEHDRGEVDTCILVPCGAKIDVAKTRRACVLAKIIPLAWRRNFKQFNGVVISHFC